MGVEKERGNESGKSYFPVVACFINTQWIDIQRSRLSAMSVGFRKPLDAWLRKAWFLPSEATFSDLGLVVRAIMPTFLLFFYLGIYNSGGFIKPQEVRQHHLHFQWEPSSPTTHWSVTPSFWSAEGRRGSYPTFLHFIMAQVLQKHEEELQSNFCGFFICLFPKGNRRLVL